MQSSPEIVAQTPGPEEQAKTPAEAFGVLGLGEVALSAIADLGFSEPTAIQQQTIPLLIAGKDVIAQAPTGTGKTAAYGLPIVQMVQTDLLQPQALVVVPTRELATQVAEALHSFGKSNELVTLPIYGGAPYERQLRALSHGVQVVVGTPGRLLDHLRRETLQLDAIKMVVLDEADEMLDMGFIEDIETILSAMPSTRQSALFSATIPPRIAKLAERYLRDPQRVSIAAQSAVAPRVRQVYYEVPGMAKPEALARILDLEEPSSAIVFVRTRKDAEEVAERLSGLGYIAQAIHGDINQSQRERVLERFRARRTQVLVATDVAARGLDIPDVSHIINYDLPLDVESYVHRIGRTGRAGKAGEAVTLVTPREQRQLRFLEKAIHHRLQRMRLPTEADIAARRRSNFREELLAVLDGGQLDGYLAIVENLAASRNPMEVAAAAFKMAAQARETSRPGSKFDWADLPATEEAVTLAEPMTPAPPRFTPRPMPAMPPPVAMENRSAPIPSDGGAAVSPTPSEPLRKKPIRPKRADFDASVAPTMVRLMLRVGRAHNVRPADIVGTIANEAGIPGNVIGDIDIYDTFSFVEIPDSQVALVRGALSHSVIRGQKPRAQVVQMNERFAELPGDRRDTAREAVKDRAQEPFPYSRPPAKSPAVKRDSASKPSGKRSSTESFREKSSKLKQRKKSDNATQKER